MKISVELTFSPLQDDFEKPIQHFIRKLRASGLIIKENPDLLNQLRKVLRAQAGYEFFVQSPSPKERYHLSLQSWTDQLITANILEILPLPPKKHLLRLRFLVSTVLHPYLPLPPCAWPCGFLL